MLTTSLLGECLIWTFLSAPFLSGDLFFLPLFSLFSLYQFVVVEVVLFHHLFAKGKGGREGRGGG